MSRFGRTGVLREEVKRVGGVVGAPAEAEAVRESFFTAGGTDDDWDRYVAPAAEAAAGQPTPDSGPDEWESGLDDDGLWQELTGALATSDHRDSEEGPRSGADDLWSRPPSETILAAPECLLTIYRLPEGILGVKVEGMLGAGEQGGLRLAQEVREAAEAGVSAVLLDLSNVSGLRFDSPGTLAACQMNVEAAGAQLALVLPDGAAAGLLEMSGIRNRTACFEDAKSAHQYLIECDRRIVPPPRPQS